MRWFKHLSTSHDDEKLAELLYCENGLEMYGLFWLILEVIAGPLDHNDNTSLEYSPKKWASFSSISTRKFKRFVQTMSDIGLIIAEISDQNIRITYPKLLKYRDEYSRKNQKKKLLLQIEDTPIESGVGQDNVAPDTDTELEENKETDTQCIEDTRQPPNPPLSADASEVSSSDCYSLFVEHYFELNNRPVIVNKGRANRVFDSLIDTYGGEKTLLLITYTFTKYIKYDDWLNKNMSIGAFETKINKIISHHMDYNNK